MQTAGMFMCIKLPLYHHYPTLAPLIIVVITIYYVIVLPLYHYIITTYYYGYHYIIIFNICIISGINDYQLPLLYNVCFFVVGILYYQLPYDYQYNIFPTMIVYIFIVVSISYPHVFCTGPQKHLRLALGLPTAGISAA